MVSIEEIITKCIQKDHKHQVILYRMFVPKMRAVCRRYIMNTDEAEDVLQDGFIKAFDNIKTFQFKGSFDGWLRKIIVNTALNHILKNKKIKNLFYETTQLEDIVEDNEQIIETDIVSIILERGFSKEDLLELLFQLPEKYRLVYNLFVFEEMSHSEISKLLNISENNSKLIFLRAKAKLKEIITEKYLILGKK